MIFLIPKCDWGDNILSPKDSLAVSVEGKLTDDSGSVGRWRPVASHLQHKVFNLNSTSSFNFFRSLIHYCRSSLTIWLGSEYLLSDIYVSEEFLLCVSPAAAFVILFIATIQATLLYRQLSYTDGIVRWYSHFYKYRPTRPTYACNCHLSLLQHPGPSLYHFVWNFWIFWYYEQQHTTFFKTLDIQELIIVTRNFVGYLWL